MLDNTDKTMSAIAQYCGKAAVLCKPFEKATLAVNKPLYWTSFDVVKKLRSILSTRKIGHAGTLDPLATGLLIICTDQNTQYTSYYQAMEKVYRGTMVLGKTTPSIDLETAFDSEASYGHITESQIFALPSTFTGHIEQTPPAYSALKVNGERAYKKTRRGQEVTLAPRQVFVQSFTVTSVRMPEIDFEVTCGKGTYIRSLVRDFGQRLGVGAYLSALCRTRIGPFQLEDAYEIEELLDKKSSDERPIGASQGAVLDVSNGQKPSPPLLAQKIS